MWKSSGSSSYLSSSHQGSDNRFIQGVPKKRTLVSGFLGKTESHLSENDFFETVDNYEFKIEIRVVCREFLAFQYRLFHFKNVKKLKNNNYYFEILFLTRKCCLPPGDPPHNMFVMSFKIFKWLKKYHLFMFCNAFYNLLVN